MDYSFIIEMDPIPSFPNFRITIVVRKNDIDFQILFKNNNIRIGDTLRDFDTRKQGMYYLFYYKNNKSNNVNLTNYQTRFTKLIGANFRN